MDKKILKKIIDLKSLKKEFAVITNLENSKTYIYLKEENIDSELKKFQEKISNFFHLRKDGVIPETPIFLKNYFSPIQVVIVGAVHIAQYFVDYAKHLNLDICIIDPRGYFASDKRFPNIKILTLWPEEAFKHININKETALITLTHDPKIDDPAIQEALKKKCFYIGALGSVNTHKSRCLRLKEAGFSETDIKKIFGPIGIKFGGKSAPEIALSIIFQLMNEIYKK